MHAEMFLNCISGMFGRVFVQVFGFQCAFAGSRAQKIQFSWLYRDGNTVSQVLQGQDIQCTVPMGQKQGYTLTTIVSCAGNEDYISTTPGLETL